MTVYVPSGLLLMGWLGRYTNAWCYEGLPGLPLQLKGPLGLFKERMEFLPSPEFLSHRGMASAVGQNVNKKQNNTRFQHTGVNFRSERNSENSNCTISFLSLRMRPVQKQKQNKTQLTGVNFKSERTSSK